MLSAIWTATSLRPFKAVEDLFLQCMIDLATSVDGKLKLPSRNLNRGNVMKLAEWMQNEIKSQIHREMDYFSTTTDMWSSRRMTALMALTLHYLTEEFEMREFTLEASPVEGNHTAEMIQNALMASFEKWGLREGKLSLMLRDSAANGVKACDDWGIKHASCINHTLHLLVGPFLVMKKKKECNEDEDELVDGDDAFEDNDDAWTDDECMKLVRRVVDDFRKATKFLKEIYQMQGVVGENTISSANRSPFISAFGCKDQMEFNLFNASEDGQNADNH